MTKVILQPAGAGAPAQHYNATVVEQIPVSRIFARLNAADRARLTPVFGGRTSVRVWGVVPGNNNRHVDPWRSIERGDISIFAGRGRLFAAGTVLDKVHSEPLAVDLWNRDEDGNAWEYVYFLDEVRDISMPYAEFNRVVGYQPGNIIRGFRVLDQDQSDRLLAALDLAGTTAAPVISVEEYRAAINTPLGPEATERQVQALARTEQDFLRNFLFGRNVSSSCCICARLLPVGLLVAAHIKKRAECNVAEKNDYQNIVAPMCRLGCDELYERSYISVDEHGCVVVHTDAPSTSDLVAATKLIQGRTCSAWREGTKRYFAYHHAQALQLFG